MLQTNRQPEPKSSKTRSAINRNTETTQEITRITEAAQDMFGEEDLEPDTTEIAEEAEGQIANK